MRRTCAQQIHVPAWHIVHVFYVDCMESIEISHDSKGIFADWRLKTVESCSVIVRIGVLPAVIFIVKAIVPIACTGISAPSEPSELK